MNNCKRALLPISRYLMTPRRNFFWCRRSPWVYVDVPRTAGEVERSVARMEREMNAAFRDFELGSRRFGFPKAASVCESSSAIANRLFPTAIEAGENGGKYVVKIDFGADFKPEDIKLSLKDRMLTIESKIEQKSEDGNSRVYQEFTRSFTLPEHAKVEEVKSLFTPEGVLRIETPLPEIPKPEPPKRIEIPIVVESKTTTT